MAGDAALGGAGLEGSGLTGVASGGRSRSASAWLWPLASAFRHRHLLGELTRREITDRYAGHWLGFVWVFLQPLLLATLYVFVFGFVLPARLGDSGGEGGAGGPGGGTVYILTGLVPWLTIAEVANRMSGCVRQHAGLVKQITFPVELLPMKGLLASLATQAILTVLLLGYAVFTKGLSPWTGLLLPAALAIEVVTIVGLAFAVSAIGALVDDTRDVVGFLTTAGLFTLPVLFVPAVIEAAGSMGRLLWLNPLSHLIWCHQDAVFHGSVTRPWSWVIASVFGAGLMLLGVRLFAGASRFFGDRL